MLDLHHLKDNQTTYFEHLIFALGIVLRLIPTILLLVVHAVLPIVKMPKIFSISGTSDYLYDQKYKIRLRVLSATEDVSDKQ